MKFLWTTIEVSDMKRSMDFYTNVVGLTVDRHMVSPTGMELAFLGDGETKLELIFNSADGDVIHSKHLSIGFEVDSLQAMQTKLESMGIVLAGGIVKPAPHIQFMYILDPDGVKVQFVEHLKG